MKDFYAILNVPRTASADEIQAAYRDLAKVLHPDVNNRGAGLMRDVNEAYATLRDPAKRKRYDIESKVRQFVPPVSAQARESFQPGGAVDLVKLASAFISPDLRAHVMPTLIAHLDGSGHHAGSGHGGAGASGDWPSEASEETEGACFVRPTRCSSSPRCPFCWLPSLSRRVCILAGPCSCGPLGGR